MKRNLLFKTALLLLCLAAGVNVGWAQTAIPLSVGDYLVTSTSATTGTIKNDDGGNLGGIKQTSTPTTATFSLTVAEAQDMVLTFLTGNGNSSNPQVAVALNNGTSDVFTKTEDITNSGGWTPVTERHTFDLGNVAAGTYTLKFTFLNSNNSDYVCNLGSIGIYNKAAYIASLDHMPDDVTLDTTKGAAYTAINMYPNSDGIVGYVSNGRMATYTFNNTVAGAATLNMGLYYIADGTINVKIIDVATGTKEIDTDVTIDSNVGTSYDNKATLLGDLSTGLKVMKLNFSTSGSFLCNYKNVSLGIDPSNWKDIAIDLRDGQLGTEANTAYTKYLTIDGENSYSYADAEPESYNAILSCTKFNDNTHGYVGFKAKVPVAAGIYKITLGTCAWGSNACVKNSDETSTLNVTDVNGQTVQSVNQNNGACYHNNTTENVVSMWYTASTDETITIVCGNYTPYFAIEKVSSVPELKYVVTYAKGDGVEGTVPSVAYATAGTSVTLPVNRTLYKDGYTLTGWNDGTTTYETGTNYTPTANVTLTAEFTQNTYTFDQTVSEMTVRWDFQRQNGCPLISMQGSGATAFLVQQADVNGNAIDMKLDIDATSGKFANGSWTDWAQVNENTTLSFPSVEGATVKAYTYSEPKNGSNEKSNVDGNEYSGYAGNITTYATTPTSGSSTLTVKGGDYYRYIEVTYPAAAITGITELTVDGTAVGSDIILAINTGDAYTATLTGNTYTTVPTVLATFDTSAQATGVVSGTGTSRTYTITQNDKTYTLVIEGIHIYSKGEGEETVNLKYTSDGNDKVNEIWTNGIYSVSPVGDGWNNSGFKLKASNGPFTLKVPSDVQVKQFIIHEFKDNYSDGSFNMITSDGMTTVYIPTKHNLGHTDADKYDLIINLDGHQAGKDIVFSFTGGSQITGWYELTVAYSNPGTEPQKTNESVTVVNNHAVVAVTFDREIPGDVTATINETTVTAEGGASTLYFPVWNLSYSTNYTLTIAANAVEDAYGNKNSSAIEIAVNVPAKATVAQAAYDYVVGNATELLAALDAIQTTNQNDKNAARKTVFLKNGDYNLGSSSETVRWVRSHNLSLIGESRDGVVIHGTSDGISNPVLNLRYWQGFYLQDLTVRNDKNYGMSNKNGVAVAIYGGDKTVMKNVRMQSNQDTQVTGDRAYFEDCKIHGTVDFICGGGDNFYYHTELILEDRGGNVIVAPSTNSSQKWGYVFQECTVSGVDATAAATNAGSYYLGRPWQNEPRSYFLNTTMSVLPNNDGWTSMETLPTHFYEYNSMNGNGDALDLSGRTNSSSSTNTYTPVLTADEAAKYTLQNVLGGTDSWLPTDECPTLAATTLSINGTTLSWTAVDDARCYVVFKNGQYLTNLTETTLENVGYGYYTVKAANLNGGLGSESNKVEKKQSITFNEDDAVNTIEDTYGDVTLTRTIGAGKWNTICLPFSMTAQQVTTTFGKGTKLATVSSYNSDTKVLTMSEATEITANVPCFIRVPADITEAKTIEGVTIVEATPEVTISGDFKLVGTYAETTLNDGDCYVKDNGLRRATGTQKVKPFRAYFTGVPTGTNAPTLVFDFEDGEGSATSVSEEVRSKMEEVRGDVFDLQGRKVAKPTKGLYIVNGKKVVIK